MITADFVAGIVVGFLGLIALGMVLDGVARLAGFVVGRIDRRKRAEQ